MSSKPAAAAAAAGPSSSSAAERLKKHVAETEARTAQYDAEDTINGLDERLAEVEGGNEVLDSIHQMVKTMHDEKKKEATDKDKAFENLLWIVSVWQKFNDRKGRGAPPHSTVTEALNASYLILFKYKPHTGDHLPHDVRGV